jgi:hypothetical protein
MRVIRNPGWFGEHGMPVNSGCPSSTVRVPAVTASIRARVPVAVVIGPPQ